jgi:hypothetical protein
MLIPAGSPDIQEILRAEFRLERLRATRGLLQNVLVIDGVLVWLDAMIPSLFQRAVVQLAVFVWPGCFAILVAAWFLEYRTRKRLEGLLETGPRNPE